MWWPTQVSQLLNHSLPSYPPPPPLTTLISQYIGSMILREWLTNLITPNIVTQNEIGTSWSFGVNSKNWQIFSYNNKALDINGFSVLSFKINCPLVNVLIVTILTYRCYNLIMNIANLQNFLLKFLLSPTFHPI